MEKTQEITVHNEDTVKKLYQEFGDITTLHGMKRAVGSHTCWKRLVWTLLVLTGTGLALYQFICIVEEFRMNPVSTVVSIEYVPRLEFPAVTLCNLNHIRLSRASQAIHEFLNRNEDIDAVNTRLDELLADISEEQIKYMGHTLEEMLLVCKFNGLECSHRDFKYNYNQKYVNCYTFGYSNSSILNKRYTTKTGPENGLILELDIQQYDYLPITASAGVKVVLHPDTEIPFPEDGGMFASPGFVTSIAARRVETHRQPFPHGSCVSLGNDELTLTKTLFSTYGYRYTDNECKKTCYQLKVFKSCNCCDIDYPCPKQVLLGEQTQVRQDDDRSRVMICNSSNAESWQCVNKVEQSFWTDELGCANLCPPACHQIKYNTIVSMGVWPSNQFVYHIIRKMNQSGTNLSGQYIQNNFLKLQVYYENLNYVLIETNPAYDWSRLLSDVGGQLGLWLGCSLLTAIEILQFSLELIAFVLRKVIRSRHVVSNYEGNNSMK